MNHLPVYRYADIQPQLDAAAELMAAGRQLLEFSQRDDEKVIARDMLRSGQLLSTELRQLLADRDK